MHVTYRLVKAPSLRTGKVMRKLMNCIRGAHKATFRICEYSVQSNHVHLIVEASSKRALSRGMQGFASSAARILNGMLRRSGRLFADRYHARELATPTEVRNALRYVLRNHEKHMGFSGVDFWSSGPWFAGWSAPVLPPQEPSPAAKARTWLLSQGWRRAGPGI